jgi:hypothetical protein
LLATGFAAPVGAQPLGPLEPVAPAAPGGGPPLASTPILPHAAPRPNVGRDRPPAVLGAPVGVGEVAVTPAGFVDAPATPKPQRAASLGLPRAAGPGAAIEATPAAPAPSALVEAAIARPAAPAADPVNDFLSARSELRARQGDGDSPRRGADAGGPPKWGSWVSRQPADWGERINDVMGVRNGWFRSDHTFDGFISPVTNPFLFEDPRSLTELRPIFIYQNVPSGQPDFRGGHVSYFGAQGRLALTDRWSIVFSKFGGIWTSANSPSYSGTHSGFAELWLGPKWTFYRGLEDGILAAAGLQFQIPAGPSNVFQDTGTLSIVPYVSYAQNFLRDFRPGSFNFMANTGYAFSVNNQRSDYYWLSAHLDFDVGNLHRFYPLVEMNWFLVTADGRARPVGAEGRDLFNVGGQASGTGLLTGAFGGRVKITESAQIGAAFEFPFAGKRDFFQNRFTIDFILRY